MKIGDLRNVTLNKLLMAECVHDRHPSLDEE